MGINYSLALQANTDSYESIFNMYRSWLLKFSGNIDYSLNNNGIYIMKDPKIGRPEVDNYTIIAAPRLIGGFYSVMYSAEDQKHECSIAKRESNHRQGNGAKA